MAKRSDFFNAEDLVVTKRDQRVKKDVGRTAIFLIIYHIIMAVCSIIAMLVAINLGGYFVVSTIQMSAMAGTYTDALMIGLLVSTFFGVILFLYLEKGSDLIRILMERHANMTAKRFLQLIVALMAVQVIFSASTTVFEWVFNLFGFSMMQSVEAASLGGYSLPIILYAGIIGPITEEVIFRGAILHYLGKHGKWFAMVMSSFLFGVFHGNLPQGVFAFLIGLIFAYVTYEYSIKWAIYLHIFNNLILNIFTNALADYTSVMNVEIVQTGLFLISFIYTCIIIWQNKAQIKTYITTLKSKNAEFREAFSSGALWILIIILGFVAISMITSI